jgi:hypothetical protein
MADLPSYQSTGRVYSDLPQLDFANVRESFKQSQAMSAQLDRLSSYAFTEMGKETEKQAAQFAVDNPLTVEQVKEAGKSGLTAADLVKASGGGEKWQDTIRKIQGEQLKNQLEVKTKDDLIKIKAQVDLLQLTDPNEIKAKYEAAISGTGKIIGQINPEAQVRYEASMGAIASSFYKENVETLTKSYRTAQEGLSYQNMQHSTTAWQSMMNVVTDPLMQNEVLQSLGRQVFNQAIEAGPEFAAKQEQAFYKKAKDLQTSFFVSKAVSPEFGLNPATNTYDISYALKKLASGDFGEHSAVYQYSIEDKKKISDDAYGLINTQYMAVKNQRDAQKEQAKVDMMGEISLINKGKVTGKAADSIMDNAFAAGIITDNEHATYYEKKLKGAPPSNNQKVTYELAKRDIVTGRIKTDSDLRRLYPTLHVDFIPDAMGLMTSNDLKEKEKLHNKYSGAEGDPYRTKPETNNNYVDLGQRYDRLILETNKDGTLKYPSAADAMAAAQKERMDSVEIVKKKKNQVVLYDILKDTYKFNPDNGGFEEFVKSKEKANRNYKSTPSYTEFKDRLDEYNRYKSSTGMIGANIKKELDTGTNR